LNDLGAQYTMPQSWDEEEAGNGNTYAPFHIPIRLTPVMADQYAPTPLVPSSLYMENTSESVLIGEKTSWILNILLPSLLRSPSLRQHRQRFQRPLRQ
jgi:hypothetical protein